MCKIWNVTQEFQIPHIHSLCHLTLQNKAFRVFELQPYIHKNNFFFCLNALQNKILAYFTFCAIILWLVNYVFTHSSQLHAFQSLSTLNKFCVKVELQILFGIIIKAKLVK